MSRILIVEDEVAIADLEKDYLELSGFEVEVENDGTSGLARALAEDFDLFILDLMLPGIDGFEICKRIREKKNTPILMVSAKKDDIDKIRGLGLGADDYVTKPFSPSELMARVDAIYRRVEMTRGFRKNDTTGDSIVLDEFELNLRNRTLSKFGTMIELTQVEFQIIEYFFKNPNAALSRNDILKQVWGENYFGDVKIVDVNIRRLRMKIEDNPSSPTRLVTIWGLGYKWITDAN